LVVQPLFTAPRREEFQARVQDAVLQLSSGLRVNSAADDAASLGVSQVITSQVIKANVEIRNLNDTISSYQEADGHLSGMTDVLSRMKDLAIQARNEALGEAQLDAIFLEFEQLLEHYSSSQSSAGVVSSPVSTTWTPPANQIVGSLSWQAIKPPTLDQDEMVQPQYLLADGAVILPGTTGPGNTGRDLDGNGDDEIIESTASSGAVSGLASTAYFSVTLNANQWYRFNFASAYADTFLSLVDADGNTVASGSSANLLTVNLQSGGSYFVKATRTSGGTITGASLTSVTLQAEAYHPDIPSTGDTHIDSVLTGGPAFWRSVGQELDLNGRSITAGVNGFASGSALTTITYSFMNTASGGATSTGGTYSAYPTGSVIGNSADDQYGRVPFTADQQAAVRRALDYYSSIIGVTFVEKTDGSAGNLNFANNTQTVSGGYAYSPQSIGEKTYIYMNNTATYTAANNLEDGDYGYTALIHEIGHAMGLKHPGNYNAGGGGASPPYLPGSMDSRAYTTMSYSTPSGWTGTDASTMGYLDIAALQYLYGKGDNPNQTFTFTDSDASVLKTIWATGDDNVVNVSALTNDVSVDLRGGSFISINGNSNIGVAYGTDIDDLYLGDSDAVVYADADGLDVFRDDGDVTFTGGRGTDRIILAANAANGPIVVGGTLGGYDTFYDYDARFDQVVTSGVSIATASVIDGIDSSLTLSGSSATIQSHRISSDGLVTFSTNDSFDQDVELTSLADVAVAVQYLQGNDIGGNTQVTFQAMIDGELNTFMFVQGQAANNNTDYLIRLVSVDANAYSSTSGQSASTGSLTASVTSLPSASSSQISRLNDSRATVVAELQSVYEGLKAAFQHDSHAIMDNANGFDLSSLIAVLEKNIDAVTAQRSVIGALTNAAESHISALGVIANNLQDANSRIVDTDYASATAELTKGQILQQAFVSMASIRNDMSRQLIETLLR
jgi:flagellin-like hook-associated protein FlgL